MAARLYGILGTNIMRWAMIEGKCGLLALLVMRMPRQQRQLEDGPRALAVEPRHHHDAPDDRTVQGLLVRPDGGGRQGRSTTALVMQSLTVIIGLDWLQVSCES